MTTVNVRPEITYDSDLLLDQRLFTLEPERYDAFVQALDNPPAPGPKLKALLRRTPAWEA